MTAIGRGIGLAIETGRGIEIENGIATARGTGSGTGAGMTAIVTTETTIAGGTEITGIKIENVSENQNVSELIVAGNVLGPFLVMLLLLL